MEWDVAGLGNALVDALVVLDDDTLIERMGLVRGTMHPVDHHAWQAAYERVRHLKVTFDPGGSCANTISTVGMLGGRAVYCGQVGNDQMGHMYGSKLVEACGSHALRFTEDHATGKCLSVISSTDAERTMLTDLGAAVMLHQLGDFGQTLRRSRIGHFEGYMLLGPESRQVVLEGMHHCREGGGLVSLDASDPFVVVQLRDVMWSMVERYVDLIFLNADEAEALTGKPAKDAIRHIGEAGHVRTVVVKLGSRGSLVMHEGMVHEIAIRKVRALDTTGAGDAYAGGFLFGMAQGLAPRQCGELASAVAALTVAQVGAVVKDRSVLASTLSEIRASSLGAAP